MTRRLLPVASLLLALLSVSSCVLWKLSESALVSTRVSEVAAGGALMVSRDYVIYPTIPALGELVLARRDAPTAVTETRDGLPVGGAACLPDTNLLYTVSGGLLAIYDLSAPGHPVPVGQCAVPEESVIGHLVPRGEGAILYLATPPPSATDLLTVVDASLPLEPKVVPGSVELPGDLTAGTLNRLICTGDGTVWTVSIADPLDPIPEGTLEVGYDVDQWHTFVAAPDRLLVVQESSIAIFEDTPTSAAAVLSLIRAEPGSQFNAACLQGDTLYAGYLDSSRVVHVAIWNVSTEAARRLGTVDLGNSAFKSMLTDGTRLHILMNVGWDWSVLYTVDVADPGNPAPPRRTILGGGTGAGPVVDGLHLVDGFLYCVLGDHLFCILG